MFKYAPRRGAARRGRGWAPATGPGAGLADDQRPGPGVLAVRLRPRPAADRGADGHRPALRRLVLLRPVRLGAARRRAGRPTRTSSSSPSPALGKSGTTKAFCTRMMPFGYRTLVLGDPKDEYESLCRALGVEPFVIAPGFWARINPLAKGPLGHGWDKLSAEEAQRRATIIFSRWLVLVRGLVGSMKIDDQRRVPFGPDESDVVRNALADPHRLRRRQQRSSRRPPSRGCGTCCATPPRSSSGLRVRERPASSSTRPGCCATRSASWSPAPSPASSTTSPTSRSTGAPRSSRSASPGSTAWATRRWASRCCA